MSKVKLLAGGLTLSAAALVGLLLSEGYTSTAIIPTENDRPTLGFGSTFHEDGSPVRLGEATTPPKAVSKMYAHLSKDEQAFRRTLSDIALSQDEYDVYMDWVYQYGIAAWRKSSMLRNLTADAPNYVKACESLLLYKYAGGYNCATPGNKVCSGVWTRQLERYDKCMAAQ